MLAAVDAGLTWDQLQERHKAGTLVSRRAGTTAHRVDPVYHSNLDGLVDPILEWLNREEMIVNDAAWVPLWFSGDQYVLIKPHVKGYKLTPMIVPKHAQVSIE